MPTLVLPVPETYDSITRPVIYDVTRKLFKWTGLHENTPIMYMSPNGATMQPGSTLLHNPEDSELAFDDQVTVEVEEDTELDRILSTAVVQPENLFIFNDPRVETMMKPAYSSTQISINFKFRAIDEVKAKRWRDQIRMRMSQMRDLVMLDIRYSYQVPGIAIHILEEIHRLMENVAPYHETFAQWFKNASSPTMSLVSNFSGEQKQPVISERQGEIVGYWDFEGEPEKGSKEDEGETWTVSFAFKFKYDKPLSVVLQYPQVIHNQVIKYKDTKPPHNPNQIQKNFTLSKYYFDHFDRTRALDRAGITGNQGIMMPEWDEFVPNQLPPYYLKIFSGMTTLDLSPGGNPKLLMNLDQLSQGYFMDDAMKAFMIGEAPYLTQQFQSVFTCNLYMANSLRPDGSIVVDNTLGVHTTFNPNPRARWHVWFGLCFNWSVLSPEAIQRLRMNYPLLARLIQALWPWWKYDIKTISRTGPGANIVTKDSMNAILGMSPALIKKVQFNTAGTFYIQAMEPTNAAG